MIKVLMTGAGAPGGPGIIKALQKDRDIELWTADADDYASGRFLNARFVKLPKADSPNFIGFILEFCLITGIQVIFPLVTMELFKFAKRKKFVSKKWNKGYCF